MNNMANKKSVLLIVALSSFLSPFINSSITVAIPSIGNEFAIDAVLLSWVATSYLLAAAVFLVPFGRIADIFGRKRVFTYGILIYTISSFVSAVSASATLLFSFRILQGIGNAMVFATGLAILTSVFPVDERGRALGINGFVISLGSSLGPFLGGFLTHHFGWRSIFFMNVPIGSIIILLIFWKLKGEWTEAKGERFDFTGSIIYGIMLIAIMYGFSLLPAMSGVWLILVGVLGILAFVRWEIKEENPILDINLFRNNIGFAFSNLAALIFFSATWSVSFLLSLYLQYIKSYSPQNVGLILMSQSIAQTLFSPFAGRLTDKIEPKMVASVGMGLTIIGLFTLTFLNEKSTLEFIIASLILLGFGHVLFSISNIHTVMSSVETRYYGVASGTRGTMRLIGQMLSMGIVMTILTMYIGRVQITPKYYSLFTKSVKAAFIIFAVLCSCGMFASLRKKRGR